MIEQAGIEMSRIPIEDVGIVLLDSHGITLTQELIVALSSQNAVVIFCDSKHLPCASVMPFTGNALHAKTLILQAECSVPKKKHLWKQVVCAKIAAQAKILRLNTVKNHSMYASIRTLEGMVLLVKSGDITNQEARAAAHYFPLLFGEDFLRDRDDAGVNAALNYGYAVLRAMVARAIVGSGLHPALGIFHHGPMNPYNLADDLMEPLRPLVDELVFQTPPELLEAFPLSSQVRADLLQITVCTVKIAGKPSAIQPALTRYVASCREAICGEGKKLVIPEHA